MKNLLALVYMNVLLTNIRDVGSDEEVIQPSSEGTTNKRSNHGNPEIIIVGAKGIFFQKSEEKILT